MKNKLMALLSLLLSFNLIVAFTADAAGDINNDTGNKSEEVSNSQEEREENEADIEGTVQEDSEEVEEVEEKDEEDVEYESDKNSGDDTKENEENSNTEETEVTEDEEKENNETIVDEEIEEDEEDVEDKNKEARKEKKKHVKGLLKAFKKIQGTPAADVITKLMGERINVEDIVETLLVEDTDEYFNSDFVERAAKSTSQFTTGEKEQSFVEMKEYADAVYQKVKKEKLDKIKKKKVLADLASLYEKSASFDEAIEVQKEAVLEDIKDLESYKKLSKLYEKKGNKQIKAYVNGREPAFDVPPVIKENRTLVPFRAISESLQASVNWDATSKTVTVERDGVSVQLTIGENVAIINGENVQLDVAADVLQGRTLIPLRFIGEAFNSAVNWDSETKSIIILENE